MELYEQNPVYALSGYNVNVVERELEGRQDGFVAVVSTRSRLCILQLATSSLITRSESNQHGTSVEVTHPIDSSKVTLSLSSNSSSEMVRFHHLFIFVHSP